MADAGQESSEGISVSKPVARVMMLVNAAVWGSGYTMLKHVQENMPTQWMMFFRMASAVLLMAIVFFPRLRRIRLRRYIVPGLILALTYWLGFIFQLKGLETTSPGRNSFFTDTYCVMVPFVVWAFTRKRPSWQHLVAAFVCAFGIGLVSLSGGGGAELMHMSFGDAMTIIGAFFFLGGSGITTIMGDQFQSGIMNDWAVWLAHNAPLNKYMAALIQMVVGALTGLDGSGFSGLPLTGSLARTFGLAVGASVPVLASLGQITAIFVGGGTIVPWGLIPVAAICDVSPLELARKNLLPVLIGFICAFFTACLLL